MKSIDQTGLTFVNIIVGSGVLNGVVNLSFASLLFTPADDEKTVDPDPAINCRLRMDVMCARQLHETLGRLLGSIDAEQPKEAAVNGSVDVEEVRQQETVN